MRYAGACAHYLHFIGYYLLCMAHTVLMLQGSVQYNGYDLHIVMRMPAKALPTGHYIIIQNTQCTKMHLRGIVPARKAERMVSVQPAVVSVASFICCIEYCFCHNYVFKIQCI